ncbi:MAG: hypothetical protein ACLPID_12610 [Beijerinckiaceae bacterium]
MFARTGTVEKEASSAYEPLAIHASTKDQRVTTQTFRFAGKITAVQTIDVELPTTDGRTVVVSRYTKAENDQLLLLRRSKLELPARRRPKIIALESREVAPALIP